VSCRRGTLAAPRLALIDSWLPGRLLRVHLDAHQPRFGLALSSSGCNLIARAQSLITACLLRIMTIMNTSIFYGLMVLMIRTRFRTATPRFFIVILDKPNTLGYTGDPMLICRVHKVQLICFCPACRGAARSARKARSSRRNGKLGGRPQKKRTEGAQ
jgi:hypothetical protein